VVCHTLLLFGKLALGIISFDFLNDSSTRTLPLLSFLDFYTDPLHNQPFWESAMLHALVLVTIRGCIANFIAFLYKA